MQKERTEDREEIMSDQDRGEERKGEEGREGKSSRQQGFIRVGGDSCCSCAVGSIVC